MVDQERWRRSGDDSNAYERLRLRREEPDTVAQEIRLLTERNRRLQQENERLQAEVEQLRADLEQAGTRSAPA